ncbi:MAG TPA: amidohydrolase family protein [Chloroflexota bacterium]|nr:amidohydrolase family protein [Chloroflexota bacterium]
MVIDADAHVEEWAETFSDKYLDPAFRARRPEIVVTERSVHWLIDSQLFPRFTGPGAHSLGTPTGAGLERFTYTRLKPESVESQELRDLAARLADMDREGIDVQVIYPTLFLVRLTEDPAFAAALCASYNRWLGDVLAGQERLKWVGVVALDDPAAAAQEVRRVKELGAVGVMIHGTAGTRMLNHPSLLPFWEECARNDLAVAVHVAWSCPPLNQMFDQLYYATLIPFVFPVLMGFITILSGGLLDRYPTLRIGFFEAGCQWVHFLIDRMDHRYAFLQKVGSGTRAAPVAAQRPPSEYLRSGQVYISGEVEDALLPQAIALVGEDQFLFASDMPHVDREPYAARILQERPDLSATAKQKILEANPRRFYRL